MALRSALVWPRTRSQSDKPFYIGRERIEQAKRMIAAGRQKGIEFVLPVDFVSARRPRCRRRSARGDQQFDVGPKTSELFEQQDRRVHRIGQAARSPRRAAGGISQRRVRHVRGPAVRGRHAAVHPAAQANERCRASRSTSAAAKGAKRSRNTASPIGSRTLSRPAARCSTRLGSAPVPYLQALAMAARPTSAR